MIQCDSQFQQYRLVGKLIRVLNLTLNHLNPSKIVINFSIARFCSRLGCINNWVGSYMTWFWKILKNAILKKENCKREGNSECYMCFTYRNPPMLSTQNIFFFSPLSAPPHTLQWVLHVLHIFCLLLLKILLVGSIGYPARFWYFFILVVSPLCYCLYTNLGFVQFWWWMGHTKKETSNTLLVISWAIWLHSANT